MLAQTIRRLRKTFRKIHAAIAVAKLRRLRNELMDRRGFATASDAARLPQSPLILGDKWDF